MSDLNQSSNLFLGTVEQQKLDQFLGDDGYRARLLDISQKFGLIRNDTADGFTSGLVTVDGSNPNCVKIAVAKAINSLGQLLNLPATNAIAIPADSNWYWVYLTYAFTNNETGTISVDSSGNLVGIGTTFTQSLRGMPDFPSVVRLSGSVYNTGLYSVLSVTDDTHAQLQGGAFTVETGLQVQVYGTFTPGYVPNPDEQFVFEYDFATIGQTVYSGTGYPPALTVGTNIVLARIQNNSGTLIIEDKRDLNVWMLRPEQQATELTVPIVGTSIFGTEQVMWQSPVTDQSRNSALIAWGMRSTNWTINSNLNILSIIGGNGGIAKSTSNIVNNQFNGWRVYTTDGTYRTVMSTVVVGTQINLYLDQLNPASFPASSLITIVPNAEEIEIIATPLAIGPNNTIAHSERFYSAIKHSSAIISLAVFNSGVNQAGYKLQYRLKNNQVYSAIYDDNATANVYYNELAFDTAGTLIDPTKTTTGIVDTIYVQLNPGAAYILLQDLSTGDLQGWENISTWNNTNPIINFQTGVRYNNVRLNGADFTPAQDCVLNLKTLGAKAGSSFSIFLGQTLTFNPTVYSVTINQDYVNPGSPGTVLYTFDNETLGNLTNSTTGVRIKCVFDGTNWNIIWLWDERYQGSWKSYTPTFTDGTTTVIPITATSGANVASYKLIGKTLFIKGAFQFTSSGSYSLDYNIGLPYINGVLPTIKDQQPIGILQMFIGSGGSGARNATVIGQVGTSNLITRDIDFTHTPGYQK